MHKVNSNCGSHSGIMKVLQHQPLSLCDSSDFVKEAICLSRLQHPCITPVLSCGLNPLNVVWHAAAGSSAMEHMDKCTPLPHPSADNVILLLLLLLLLLLSLLLLLL